QEELSGEKSHSCYSENWDYPSNLWFSLIAVVSMSHYGIWSVPYCQTAYLLQPPPLSCALPGPAGTHSSKQLRSHLEPRRPIYKTMQKRVVRTSAIASTIQWESRCFVMSPPIRPHPEHKEQDAVPQCTLP
ncbi:hypothetical protein GOODEAATRI_016704, partial [Goodea atripinnis]